MYTFQDFQRDTKAGNLSKVIGYAISMHKASEAYRVALDADEYDKQRNTTISKFSKIYTDNIGEKKIDTNSANNRLCSNFFKSLNMQRNSYSLGNGIQFEDAEIKSKLGEEFDTELQEAGYFALIHGMSFMFWNVDHVHVFKLTEFVPLWDENTGSLRAGIRFWQIDDNKPVNAVLYEEDGYTKFVSKDGFGTGNYEVTKPKSAYRINYKKAEADTEPEIINEENYSNLPIFPLLGNRYKESTNVFLKAHIDAYDLIKNGFIDTVQDCSEIYWLINNAGGMDDNDISNLMKNIRDRHVATVTEVDEATITPYTQEIPFQARQATLQQIKNDMYEDFHVLDVHTVEAGSTNDHIDAGYQPMDLEADEYEKQIIDTVMNLTELAFGKKYIPLFTRNKISNKKEQTDMVIECSQYLDRETILKHLPFLTPDEIDGIMLRKDKEEMDSFIDDEDNGELGTNKADLEAKKEETHKSPLGDE